MDYLAIEEFVMMQESISAELLAETFNIDDFDAEKAINRLQILGVISNEEIYEGEYEVLQGGLPIDVVSLAMLDKKLSSIDPLEYVAISFYDDPEAVVDYPDVMDVFYANTLDIDYPAISNFSTFFPNAEAMADFIIAATNDGKKILCQCTYGSSRSAAVAAAIAEAFYDAGDLYLASFRYKPNKFIYRKLLTALKRKLNKTVD